jgi:hypothetical protein
MIFTISIKLGLNVTSIWANPHGRSARSLTLSHTHPHGRTSTNKSTHGYSMKAWVIVPPMYVFVRPDLFKSCTKTRSKSLGWSHSSYPKNHPLKGIFRLVSKNLQYSFIFPAPGIPYTSYSIPTNTYGTHLSDFFNTPLSLPTPRNLCHPTAQIRWSSGEEHGGQRKWSRARPWLADEKEREGPE